MRAIYNYVNPIFGLEYRLKYTISSYLNNIKMMPLVSIIIPVYNVAKYLSHCLNSVLSQNFKDFEILLVNDGSTDTSDKICNEYAEKDNRIRVFHKENGGLSSARNYGLKKSNGKYVIFLDSDDFWSNDDILLSFFHKAEDNNLDVVRGEYYNVDSNGFLLYTPKIPRFKLSLVNNIMSSYEMMKYVIGDSFFPWLFFYKKDSINKLFFDENRKFQEDIDFEIRYFSQELKCGYLPIQFYAYRHRANSIISTPRLINLSDSFSLTDVFYEYAHKVKDKRLSQLYLYRGIMMYYWTLETVASDLYIKQYREIVRNLDLKSLRRRICSWIRETQNKRFPIHCYVSPFIGIYLFRLRWRIGNVLRFLKILPTVKNIF